MRRCRCKYPVGTCSNPPQNSTPLLPIEPAIRKCNDPCGNINIYNTCGQGSCPCPPTEDGAGIMALAEGSVTNVGRDFVPLRAMEFIQQSTDPILVTANVNWMSELANCCQCPQQQQCQLPMGELVLTRQILDMQGRVLEPEKEMARMIEAAPAFGAPVMSNMQNLNPEELRPSILPARMIYRVYFRVTDGVGRTVNPYKILARQYPEKA